MPHIRLSRREDLETLRSVFDAARRFMRATGNKQQWVNGYPSRERIMDDIRKKQSYVLENDEGRLVATFCFFQGIEPNYSVILDGKWLNDLPYGVIHRLASDGTLPKVADICIDWCFAACPNLRVDTHNDNTVMQNILRRKGFVECGVIFVEDGTPRIAFQKTR